jgi:hypothetical protein
VFGNLGRHLTYANVMATLAVIISLGGSSYAALRITGRDIAAHTLTDRNIKRNALTGRSINEARVGKVPRTRNADRLGGQTAGALKIHCPTDTLPFADLCVEKTPRAAAPYGTAVVICAETGTPQAPGRRLPTHGELTQALTGLQLADGGELTGDVYPSGSDPGRLDVLYVTDRTGRVGVTPDTAAGAKAFRCATDPLN